MKDRIITIYAVPKSAKNEIIGWVMAADNQKTLKVKVAAPPENGKANRELIAFLAKEWGVPKASLELVGGENARYKRFKIHNDMLLTRLRAFLS